MQRTIKEMFKRKERVEEADVVKNKVCRRNEVEAEQVETQGEEEEEEAETLPEEVTAGPPPPEASTGDSASSSTLYPSVWKKEQYKEFGHKNEWLYAHNGKLGCTFFRKNIKNEEMEVGAAQLG